MNTSIIPDVLLVGALIISAGFCIFFYRNKLKLVKERQRLSDELDDTQKSIDQKVRERTRQLEEIRDSVTGYAVQRFELAQELESRNRELLEQKDLSAKQTEKLRIAYEEIKSLEGFRRQMARTLVHDLKNPLNIILNLTETGAITATNGKLIRQISFEMLDLILNILEVQKFEEMKVKLNLEDLQFIRIVNKNIEKISSLLRMSELNLISQVPDKCWLRGDRQVLDRIMGNLLGNAIKYTSPGGTIRIVASEKEEGYLIEVIDDGDGIPEKYHEGLFEMFSQGPKKESMYNSSTGIGLAYCRLAVNSLGGEIGIKSLAGEGTTVWFTCKSSKPESTSGISRGDQEKSHENVEFDFTEEDRSLLRQVASDLQNTDIFEITKIMNLIDNPALDSNERLIRWKKSVEATLYSANEKRFRELINN
jgi:signal transduction histidine kinase